MRVLALATQRSISDRLNVGVGRGQRLLAVAPLACPLRQPLRRGRGDGGLQAGIAHVVGLRWLGRTGAGIARQLVEEPVVDAASPPVAQAHQRFFADAPGNALFAHLAARAHRVAWSWSMTRASA